MPHRRIKIFALIACVAVVLAVAAPASLRAQLPDFTGTWQLDARVVLSEATPAASIIEKQGTCVYVGTVELTQDGDQVSGPVEMSYISGPEQCPAEMFGSLQGGLEVGNEIFVNGTISGQLGLLGFGGTLSPNPGGGGDLGVSEGPFAGAEGSWLAQLVDGSPFEIPTVSAIGLTLLTLTLLAAGGLILRNAA